MSQLGSKLEAQEPPKSKPKCEIDIKKQHVFEIDFWVARAWFLIGFWMVFGSQIHAKSNMKKNVREPFCTVKTNTKSMSALLLQRLFEAKIDEKSLVSWNIAFGSVLEGFWEGFGRPKTLIFALFSSFFRSKF